MQESIQMTLFAVRSSNLLVWGGGAAAAAFESRVGAVPPSSAAGVDVDFGARVSHWLIPSTSDTTDITASADIPKMKQKVVAPCMTQSLVESSKAANGAVCGFRSRKKGATKEKMKVART